MDLISSVCVCVHIRTPIIRNRGHGDPVELASILINNAESPYVICKGCAIISQGQESKNTMTAPTKNCQVQEEVITAGQLQNSDNWAGPGARKADVIVAGDSSIQPGPRQSAC